MRQPPGPGLWALLGVGRGLKRDFLGTMTALQRRYGDVVRLRPPGRVVLAIFGAAEAEHVFKTNHKNYVKNLDAYREYFPLTGNGLVLISGEEWKGVRKVIGAEFTPARVQAHGAEISRIADEMVARWQKLAASSAEIDVYAEFSRVTLLIAGKTLFGSDVESDVELLRDVAHDYTHYVTHRLSSLVRVPKGWPTPLNRAMARRIEELDRVIYRMIDESRPGTPDVLSRLKGALERKDVRDQVVTLLLAAHDTTSSLLTWTLALLAQHPAVLAKAVAEQESSPGNAPYLDQVIRESLRLFPPSPLVSRTAVGPDVVGGYEIPAGSVVLFPFYVTHHLERYWPNPEAFDPDRFAAGKEHVPFSYFPFGRGGMRACIGEEMALFEARAVLSRLLRNFTFGAVEKAETEIAVTLRPKRGLKIQVRARG